MPRQSNVTAYGLTPEEASALTGYRTDQLRRMANNGVIGCGRTLRGHRRYSLEELRKIKRPIGDYLVVSEVAALFMVDPKTVLRWSKKGILASDRTPGGHHRYKLADVNRLLKQKGLAPTTRQAALDEEKQTTRLAQKMRIYDIAKLCKMSQGGVKGWIRRKHLTPTHFTPGGHPRFEKAKLPAPLDTLTEPLVTPDELQEMFALEDYDRHELAQWATDQRLTRVTLPGRYMHRYLPDQVRALRLRIPH